MSNARQTIIKQLKIAIQKHEEKIKEYKKLMTELVENDSGFKCGTGKLGGYIEKKKGLTYSPEIKPLLPYKIKYKVQVFALMREDPEGLWINKHELKSYLCSTYGSAPNYLED